MCEFWLGMATKKFQPDRLNSSGDIPLDNKGTFGLERGTIGLERQKIFLQSIIEARETPTQTCSPPLFCSAHCYYAAKESKIVKDV